MAWTRDSRLAALVTERSLLTKGFRRSLRQLVREFTLPEDADYAFEEWFGNVDAVPAAHRIIRNGDGVWDTTIEIYEVENTAEISEYKLATYGRMADGEGPLCELHILDRYDHELVVPNDLLECFAFIDLYDKAVDGRKYKKAMLKDTRCPAGGWTGMPADMDPTVENCMGHGVCGCIYGEVVRKAEP